MCVVYGEEQIRNFGFLVSQKDYVYTLDDDCLPATREGPKGRLIRVNAALEHINNLKSPATPYFFNTLYDPYAKGSDFVRGYPYSLRQGVTTAISHGIWLNAPDYDGKVCQPYCARVKLSNATLGLLSMQVV